MRILLHVVMLFGLIHSAEAAGRTYHVDSRNGSDQNTGLAPDEAWKSLAKRQIIACEAAAVASGLGAAKKQILCRRTCPFRMAKPLGDLNPIVADPQFRNPGGSDPADYVPANQELIKDQGVSIERLPGDTVGLYLGLEVQDDFFGNPIAGLPDLGAIEIRERTP